MNEIINGGTTPTTGTEIPDSSNSITVTNIDAKHLSPAKIDYYKQIGSSLVVSDPESINNFGSELSSVMSQNSEALLKTVRSSQGGEVSALTTELLGQLEMIDLDELGDTDAWKRFMRKVPILKRFVPSIAQIINKYDTIQETVEKIAAKIDAVSLVAKRDNVALQEIFNNNVEYIKQIGDLIGAAQYRREELIEQIEEMNAHPDQYEIWDRQDVANFKNDLDKKIADMQAVQYTMKMNMLQIRAAQSGNSQIANKANTFVTTVLPVWKNQLSISIMMDDQRKNSEAIKAMSDTSNKIITKNAELLKLNATNIAKETERGIFDIKSLEKSTNLMIETVKEVEKIHQEGVKQRAEMENKLMALEETLGNSVNHSLASSQGETKYIGTNTAPRTFKELKGVTPVAE